MKITIVTDGSNTLGLGHVVQSLTLADALRARAGAAVAISFVTGSEASVRALIAARGYPVEHAGEEAAVLARLAADDPDCVIFDMLHVPVDLARAIKAQLRARLITFTNLSDANRHADMTVLAAFDPAFTNLREVDPATGQLRFSGIRYWVLRPQFYAQAPKHVARSSAVHSVMLMFGGADPCDFSSRVLAPLLDAPAQYDILLVLGPAYAGQAALDAVLASHPRAGAVRIRRGVDDVAAEMRRHDLVMASPGMSFFESILVGTPLLCFHQNRQQQDAYAGVFATLGVEDLATLPQRLARHDFIYPDELPLERMAIGRGKDDLLDAILGPAFTKEHP
jgi:spore coat polysaccharide biosynthesis predicted glycosyltransferase SpsG